jgi:diacylglycerol kinase family enzyme
MSDPSGPALVVLGLGARRLGDPARREHLARAAAAAARDRGHHDVTILECADGAALRAATAEAVASRVGLVVAIGGDGTVREVVGGLSGGEVPLGIVPAGTGNLLASALGLPRDLEAALATIRTGTPRAVDHGVASWSGSPARDAPGASTFVVAAGVGLDARFVSAASADAKRRYGIGAYLVAALRQAVDLRPRPTRLIVDGVRHETDSIMVLIANAGDLIPGLLRPRLPIRPDDGCLHVFAVRGGVLGSVVGALELLAAAEPGPTATRSGMRLTAREVVVEIDVEPADPVQVDGDRVGSGRLDAGIRPAAVRVLVPSA